MGRVSPELYGSNELLFLLVAKIPRDVWDKCRATAKRKARTLTYEDLSVLLLELAPEKENDQHLNAYRPRGGNSGNYGRGYQGPRPGQGSTPKNAPYMSNVQDLFPCDARDEKGGLVQAPDCNQQECFVVKGKKHETNTGGKVKIPDYYRCTITCAFCGKGKHYEEGSYHKQRLSTKLKLEAQNGGQGGQRNGDTGKRKSKERGKGQEKAKVGDAEALTRRVRPITRTGPGENPTLPLGGPIPCPLEGSKTRGLQSLPRRRRNKNKELSVATKMGTGLTPVNAPASCGWCARFATRGLMFPVPRRSDKDALGDLQIWCSGYLSVLGDENTWGYWILGPLYRSCPRKLYLLGT